MTALFNETEVRKALSLLCPPDSVFEIRALEAKLAGSYRSEIISGYFNNAEACLKELKKLTAARGIYVTLNPVDPALLSRCANRLDAAKRYALTGDHHIKRRMWLLIDTDPKRPSGISATDAEKAAARKKTTEIYRFLKARGWPEPVVADSGNGFHLLYRVELPANDEKLLERVLCALADRFDGDGVTLDRSVFNPSRIAKLHGTLAAKGDNTKERPHRLSKIIKAPQRFLVVTSEQLRALVDELAPAEPPPAVQPAVQRGGFDVDAFLARHGVAVAERISQPNGTIKWRLERCPFNPDHETPDAAVFQMLGGKLGFKCLHTSCVDKHWQDFRRHFEPDYEKKIQAPKLTVVSEPRDETDGELTSLTSFDLTPYPAPLGPAAFHGLPGKFVKRVLPFTESDEAGLLFQFHTCFGNVIGRTAHMIADAATHYCNNNIVLVGPTSIARKGTAWRHALRIFKSVDEDWTGDCIKHGVSSGEGIIFHVRDPIKKTTPVKEKGKFTGQYETITEDPGVKDKRLMIVETEFASVLKVMERSGSTVSVVFRHMWDGDNVLSTLTKNSPVRATGAHGSVLGHITLEELRRLLTETEMANGFGNRFEWIAVHRRQELPENDELPAIADLVVDLEKSIEFARTVGQLRRDEGARELWKSVYHDLSSPKPGLFGAMIARAAPQVLRRSLQYALLDCSKEVRIEHLQAALECWRYSEESTRWVFQAGTGNRNADRILTALAAAGEKGLTKSQITSNVFNRNATKHEIEEALRLLNGLKLVFRETEETATKPAERWFYNCKKNEIYELSTPTGDTSYTSQPENVLPVGDTSYNSSFSDSKKASSSEPTEDEKLAGDESGVVRL
jgi:hypothetical protein